jgi:hypothetical protein
MVTSIEEREERERADLCFPLFLESRRQTDRSSLERRSSSPKKPPRFRPLFEEVFLGFLPYFDAVGDEDVTKQNTAQNTAPKNPLQNEPR